MPELPDPNVGYERTLTFVLKAIEERRPPRAEWLNAVHDAVLDVDRIVERDAHPDATSYARLAIGSLAAIWLDGDERDAVCLGEAS